MSQKQTAVVDSRGVYLGMFSTDFNIPSNHRRLSQIQECDLSAGEYFWTDDENNPFGGFFWPMKKRPAHKAKV
jgi:hypothetical protein